VRDGETEKGCQKLLYSRKLLMTMRLTITVSQISAFTDACIGPVPEDSFSNGQPKELFLLTVRAVTDMGLQIL